MFTIRGKLTTLSGVTQIQPICYVTSAIFANGVRLRRFLLTPRFPHLHENSFIAKELKIAEQTFANEIKCLRAEQ